MHIRRETIIAPAQKVNTGLQNCIYDLPVW
jgi:hypothetical protein